MSTTTAALFYVPSTENAHFQHSPGNTGARSSYENENEETALLNKCCKCFDITRESNLVGGRYPTGEPSPDFGRGQRELQDRSAK